MLIFVFTTSLESLFPNRSLKVISRKKNQTASYKPLKVSKWKSPAFPVFLVGETQRQGMQILFLPDADPT